MASIPEKCPVHAAALGSRVKYLVDTPELIWGCLDTREFLAAAQRLAQASVVHECLMRSGQRATIERRFPLIGHLWPSIEKFRCLPIWLVDGSMTANSLPTCGCQCMHRISDVHALWSSAEYKGALVALPRLWQTKPFARVQSVEGQPRIALKGVISCMDVCEDTADQMLCNGHERKLVYSHSSDEHGEP